MTTGASALSTNKHNAAPPERASAGSTLLGREAIVTKNGAPTICTRTVMTNPVDLSQFIKIVAQIDEFWVKVVTLQRK